MDNYKKSLEVTERRGTTYQQKPYLIQRACFRREDLICKGSIDEVVSFDYMGSSEFEFGALPMSLKRITKEIDQYKISKYKEIKNIEGKMLCILHKDDDGDKYLPFIKQMIADDGPLRLKEDTRIKAHVTGKDYGDRPASEFQLRHNIWWDLEFDIWFTFGAENMRRVQKAIIATRDEKKAEGKEEWF